MFADGAGTAALSCFARLKADQASGRTTLIACLGDTTGVEAIDARSLAVVRRFDGLEAGDAASQPWPERFAVVIRKLAPKHVLAPLGLLNANPSIDYFKTLRAAMSVDRGRDLLFYEERPQGLIPEAVSLRLSGLGVRLPPATRFRVSRGYTAFSARLVTGVGIPPIFGGVRERSKMSSALKSAFGHAAEWDPYRALGPKLQPVTQAWEPPWYDDFQSLATELGQAASMGTKKAFKRHLMKASSTSGSAAPIERYWLSLPNQEGIEVGSEGL